MWKVLTGGGILILEATTSSMSFVEHGGTWMAWGAVALGAMGALPTINRLASMWFEYPDTDQLPELG